MMKLVAFLLLSISCCYGDIFQSFSLSAIQATADVTTRPAISIGTDNIVHVLYPDSSAPNHLNYIRWDGVTLPVTSTQIQGVQTPERGIYPAILASPFDSTHLHLAYANGGKLIYNYLNRITGTPAAVQVVPGPTVETFIHLLPTFTTPIIVFVSDDSRVVTATFSSGWNTQVITDLGTPSGFQFVHAAINQADMGVHILFGTSTQSVYCSQIGAVTACTPLSQPLGQGAVGVDSNGNAYVFGYTSTGTLFIKIHPDHSLENLPTPANVRRSGFVNLKVSGTVVHLLYNTLSNNALNHNTWTDGEWRYSIGDQVQAGGMALDHVGNVHFVSTPLVQLYSEVACPVGAASQGPCPCDVRGWFGYPTCTCQQDYYTTSVPSNGVYPPCTAVPCGVGAIAPTGPGSCHCGAVGYHGTTVYNQNTKSWTDCTVAPCGAGATGAPLCSCTNPNFVTLWNSSSQTWSACADVCAALNCQNTGNECLIGSCVNGACRTVQAPENMACSNGYCRNGMCANSACAPCAGGVCNGLACLGEPTNAFTTVSRGTGVCPVWDPITHTVTANPYDDSSSCTWTIPQLWTATVYIASVETCCDYFTFNQDPTFFNVGNRSVAGPASINFTSDGSNHGNFIIVATGGCRTNSDCVYPASSCYQTQGVCGSDGVCSGTVRTGSCGYANSGTCSGSVCVGQDYCVGANCPIPSDPCMVATCDSSSGNCGVTASPNGTACGGGRTCISGVCVGPGCGSCVGGVCDNGVCYGQANGFVVLGTGCPGWDANHDVAWTYPNNARCSWGFPAGYLVTLDMGRCESGFDGFTINHDPTFYTPPNLAPPVLGPGWVNFSSDPSVTFDFAIHARPACGADTDCPQTGSCLAPYGTCNNGLCQTQVAQGSCGSTACRPQSQCDLQGNCVGPVYLGATCETSGSCTATGGCLHRQCDPCVGGTCDTLIGIICQNQPLLFSVSGNGCPGWDQNGQVQFFYPNFASCTWTVPLGYKVTISVGFIEPGFDYLYFNGDASFKVDSSTASSNIPVLVGPVTISFNSDVSVTGNFQLVSSPYGIQN
jgi:hypothetical protein